MGIVEDLAAILNARFGFQVRQAIHDSISDINDIAVNAKSSAETSQTSASASAAAALASQQAAAGSAQAAAQSAAQAMSGTPEGYADFVSNTNSSLDNLYNSGVKNILDVLNYTSSSMNLVNGVFSNSLTDVKTSLDLHVVLTYSDNTTGTPIHETVSTTGFKQFSLNPQKNVKSIYIKHNGSSRDIGFAVPISLATGNYYFSFNLISNDPTTVDGLQLSDLMIRKSNILDSTYQPYAQSNAALTEEGGITKELSITFNEDNIATYVNTSVLTKTQQMSSYVKSGCLNFFGNMWLKEQASAVSTNVLLGTIDGWNSVRQSYVIATPQTGSNKTLIFLIDTGGKMYIAAPNGIDATFYRFTLTSVLK